MIDQNKSFSLNFTLTDRVAKRIIETLLAGKNLTTLWLTKTGATPFIKELINYKKFELISRDFEEFEFISLDLYLSKEFLDQQLSNALLPLTGKNEIHAQLEAAVKKKRLIFLLDNCNLNTPDALRYINHFRMLYPDRINFLMIFVENEFITPAPIMRPDFGFIAEDIFPIPFLTKDESFEHIVRESKVLKIELSEAEVNKIYEFTGGKVILINDVLKIFTKYNSTEETLNSPEIQKLIEQVWNRYDEKEHLILELAAQGLSLPPYTYQINYLRSHGFLKQDNGLDGNWVKYVTQNHQEYALILEDEALIYNQLPLNKLLSSKELEFMKTLVENDLVTRDEVAQILWGAQAIEKYSEWSIDKFISNLRAHLVQVGVTSELFTTVRNEGYRKVN